MSESRKQSHSNQCLSLYADSRHVIQLQSSTLSFMVLNVQKFKVESLFIVNPYKIEINYILLTYKNTKYTFPSEMKGIGV